MQVQLSLMGPHLFSATPTVNQTPALIVLDGFLALVQALIRKIRYIVEYYVTLHGYAKSQNKATVLI